MVVLIRALTGRLPPARGLKDADLPEYLFGAEQGKLTSPEGKGEEVIVSSAGTEASGREVALGRSVAIDRVNCRIRPANCRSRLGVVINLFGDGLRDALDPQLRRRESPVL